MPRPPRAGDWIGGRFEVFEILEGGMSLVYISLDHQVPRGQGLVAVKTLRDEFLGDAERRGRFITECGLWVLLGKHVHVVHALGVDEIRRQATCDVGTCPWR